MHRAFNVILQWLRYSSSLRYIPYCRCSSSTLPLISVFFNLQSLPFLTLGTLTAVRHFVSPFDSLANLFAPCIAWTIIFLVSALIVPFQGWRRKLSSSAFRWIDKEEATMVICLLLAQICSAANGAGKWPYVPQNMVSLIVDYTTSRGNARKISLHRCGGAARTWSGSCSNRHLDSQHLSPISSFADQPTSRYMSSTFSGQRPFVFHSGIGPRTC